MKKPLTKRQFSGLPKSARTRLVKALSSAKKKKKTTSKRRRRYY